MRYRVPPKGRLLVLGAIFLAALAPPAPCQGVISVDTTSIAFTPPDVMVGFASPESCEL